MQLYHNGRVFHIFLSRSEICATRKSAVRRIPLRRQQLPVRRVRPRRGHLPARVHELAHAGKGVTAMQASLEVFHPLRAGKLLARVFSAVLPRGEPFLYCLPKTINDYHH